MPAPAWEDAVADELAERSMIHLSVQRTARWRT